MKILFVEDDPRDVGLVRRELENARIEMETVHSLAEARARLGEGARHDLVLADLRLPDGNGLDLLSEIRERNLPLAAVVLTGHGDEATAVAALKGGADDYVAKRPGFEAGLPLILESALARFRAEAARRAGVIRVLYGEHHAHDIELTRRHLADHAPHIRLEIVHSTPEVLARLQLEEKASAPFDVLLVDYHLPGENALELLKALKDRRRSQIPVVLVTGQGCEEVAAQALRLGVADYLVKHSGYLYELPSALENAHHRARLLEKTEELEAYFTTALDLFCIADSDGRFRRLNKVWESTLGYSLEELQGRRALRFVHPDDRRATVQAWASLRKQEVLLDFVNRFRCRDGTFRWIEWRAHAAGDLVYAAVRDVTGRIEGESRLREAQERLQRAVGAGGVGLWDWDLHGGQIYYSPEWKDQIGYDVDKIAADPDEWRSRVHPEDLDSVKEAVNASLLAPWPPYEAEFRLRHRDGSYRHILSRARVSFDPQGQPSRLLGSHVDITERVEAEARLLQAQKMECVGQLVGGVVHDFNNFLTVIAGYSELAAARLSANDPARQMIEEIAKAGDRAARLTRQLLAFSWRSIARPEVLDVNKTIAELEKMLRRLIGEHITLRFLPAPDLGRVRADPGQIEQVVVNLAVNARDAMSEGGTLTIETADVELGPGKVAIAEGSSPPGPYVRLSVSDTGVGMDESTRKRIFEPFFTTKDPGKGTGLGLSTVYGILAQSGGAIQVHSELGKGTSFEVYLPRIDEQPTVERSPLIEATKKGSETILVVEDDSTVRKLATAILEREGYEVLEADGGGEVFSVLEERVDPIHLLLTDMILPGMSGKELASQLAVRFPGIRVLFTSGYSADELPHRRFEAADFIAKPFTPSGLREKVRHVLDSRR